MSKFLPMFLVYLSYTLAMGYQSDIMWSGVFIEVCMLRQ